MLTLQVFKQFLNADQPASLLLSWVSMSVKDGKSGI